MADVGTPASAPTDAERLRWAVELARDPVVPAHPDDRTRRVGWAVLVIVVLAVAVSLADELIRQSSPVPTWRTVLGWVLTAIGLVSVVVLLRHTLRCGWVLRPASQPLQALTPPQRSATLRQVDGRDPVIPAHLTVARAVAATRCTPTLAAWLAAAATALTVGPAARHDHPGWWVVSAVVGAVVLVWAVRNARQARNARRFLAAHPQPSTEPPYD